MNPNDQRIARWLRDVLWFDADDASDGIHAQRRLEEVYRRHEVEQRRRRRRRRRRWGAAGAAAVLAGGASAAALYLRDQPSRPEAGVVCRAAARVDADATVLALGADPLEGCRQLWVGGEFSQPDGQVPTLTACVGPHGAIEVFPGDADVCAALGLKPTDLKLSPDNQAIVALQERLDEQINDVECRPVEKVVALAERLVAESGLEGWRVELASDAKGGTCGKAGLNSATKTVTVINF